MTTTSLDAIVTPRRIVRAVVRIREHERAAARERAFFHKLGSEAGGYGTRSRSVAMLLPPRREWPNPGAERRRRASRRGQDAQSQLLTEHILRRWSEPNAVAPPWLKELRRFVEGVRSRLLRWGPGDTLKAPSVVAVPKSSPGQFRCLAIYGIEDRIAISLVALYFRKVFDGVFDKGSLAFRSPSRGVAPTHHDAAKQIVEFVGKPRPPRQPNVWVAEVDIRGFFDTVSHDTARRCVAQLVRDSGGSVDPRASAVFEAYLRSYSFNHFARPRARADAIRKSGRGSASVPWPEDALAKLGHDVAREAIGIPQGGALSCFLANAVLHVADTAVRAAAGGEGVLYLRYCDDIVLLARRKEACSRALTAYGASLRELGLPAHVPTGVPYGRAFWDQKSKKPYRWAHDAVPWCAFVGYQVRHDGMLRVRPVSLRKEILKQRHIVAQAERRIDRARSAARGLSNRRAMYRVRQKLRSMSVGMTFLHLGHPRSAFSWAAGFHLLQSWPCLVGQLRNLDRQRSKVLGRFARYLHRTAQPPRGTGQRRAGPQVKFEGRPFSYGAIVSHCPRHGAGAGSWRQLQLIL
jgi:hypothetical protein